MNIDTAGGQAPTLPGLASQKPVHLLIVDYASNGSEWLLEVLRRAGFDPSSTRVQTEEALVTALGSGRWDVILLDFTVKGQSAAAALDVLKRGGSDVPIIVVSSDAGEDLAVDMMRAGASDYILKSNITRLAAAVGREVGVAQRQGERRRAEEAARQLAAIVQSSIDPIISQTLDGVVMSWNSAAEQLYGWRPEESIGQDISFIVPPDRAEEFARVMAQLREGTRVEPFETVRLHKNGTRLDVVATLSPIRDQAGHVAGISQSARDIGERKRAENAARAAADALQLSEERHRLLVESIPQMVWMADPEGLRDYVNQRGAERLGVSPEALYGWNWLELLHPDDAGQGRLRWEAAVRGGVGYANEYRMRQPNGAYRWYLAQAVVLRTPEGAVERWVGTWTDIDDRKLAEQSMARDSLLLANVRDSVIVTDRDGVVTYWNEGATRIFGWTADEMLGRPLINRFPEDVRLNMAKMTESVSGGYEWPGEFEDYHKDGSRIWIDARVTSLTDAADQPCGAMSVSHNISRRKQVEAERDRAFASLVEDIAKRGEAEAALRLSEERFRALVEHNSDAIVVVDRAATVTYASDSIERVTGMPSAGWVGHPLFEHVHPEDCATVMAAFKRAIDQPGASVAIAYRSRHEDGSWRDREASFVDRLADPAVNGIIATFRDVTERARAKKDLFRATEQLRAVVSSLPIALWAMDRDGRITLSEGKLLDRFGFVPGQLVGQSVFELYRDVPEILQAVHRVLAGEAVGLSTRAHGMTLDSRYVVLRTPDGAITGAVSIVVDVSDRVQLEEQLRQAQKMEAFGGLAAGIAHDFNNLLTAILGFAELLLERDDIDPSVRLDLKEIQSAGDSAAALTRQLLAFSRRQILQPRVLDLNTRVAQMENLLRRTIGEDIHLVTLLPPDLGRVSADPGQIDQVILNLAVNARDAMLSGGSLTIETANVELDETYCIGHPDATPGSQVMISVRDTGCGMSDATLAHLFEPFFTTKERGKGTGLGLATVYGIIKQSGGSIGVSSTPGAGSTFEVYLPRTEQPAAQDAPRRVAASLEGTETVLLVEDQAEVRAIERACLSRHGYVVIEATGGAEALRLSDEYKGSIDLLLTDVVMPAMSGGELARALNQRRPALRVLYASGYADSVIVNHGVLEPHVDFIQKPFTPESLLRTVRDVLDHR
jgi:two-component system, cell cycle sensor histidine kinase and response regulator CckA